MVKIVELKDSNGLKEASVEVGAINDAKSILTIGVWV